MVRPKKNKQPPPTTAAKVCTIGQTSLQFINGPTNFENYDGVKGINNEPKMKEKKKRFSIYHFVFIAIWLDYYTF